MANKIVEKRLRTLYNFSTTTQLPLRIGGELTLYGIRRKKLFSHFSVPRLTTNGDCSLFLKTYRFSWHTPNLKTVQALYVLHINESCVWFQMPNGKKNLQNPNMESGKTLKTITT